MGGDKRIDEAKIDWGAPADDAGAPHLHLQPGAPRSTVFNDVYFSGDGPAETTHVFIDGNNLDARFETTCHFHIGELGFGTGLNFLVAWDRWRKAAKRPEARLHFFSTEAFPLSPDDMERAHLAWPDLGPLGGQLRRRLPPPHPGLHQLQLQDDITLTLFYGDALSGLSTIRASIDAWFLDGFSPAQNPAMWSTEIMTALAGLSAPGASFATFTVAGGVRRALEAAGFSWQKRPGFGRKREMLAGKLTTTPPPPNRLPWFECAQAALAPGARVAIIGAGIAGASLAHTLTRAGLIPSVYEASAPASGASGNPGGLIMPRLDADDTPAGRFHASAYLYTSALLEELNGDHRFFGPCGIVHHATDARERARQDKLMAQHALPRNWMKRCEQGLFYPQAGIVDPRKFVGALLGTTTIIGERVTGLTQIENRWRVKSHNNEQDYDAVIIANGLDALRFDGANTLPLSGSAGQVDWFPDAPAPENAHAFGPYAAPAPDSGLIIGATYAPITIGAEATFTEEATASNIAAVARTMPDIASPLAPGVSHARASVRCTTPDRLPVVGPLPDWSYYANAYDGLRTGRKETYPPGRALDGLFILSGLGSRGLVTAPYAAAMLTAALTGAPPPADISVFDAVHPARFFIRALKRAKTTAKKS